MSRQDLPNKSFDGERNRAAVNRAGCRTITRDQALNHLRIGARRKAEKHWPRLVTLEARKPEPNLLRPVALLTIDHLEDFFFAKMSKTWRRRSMAGDWIKVEKATARKPEVLALASILQIHPDHAFGLCVRFWFWCDDNLKTGHAQRVTTVTLDYVVGHTGFADALVQVGWLSIQRW